MRTKEEISNYQKVWYKANRDWRLAKNNLYYLENRDNILQKSNEYRKTHKDLRAKYVRERTKNDIQFRLCHRLRSRLNSALKGKQKTGSAIDDLGCSLPDLVKYIESKFTDGMSWEMGNKIHIDHIIPLSLFDLTDREQYLKANHYTNLQPLWAKDNIKKRNKIIK